MPIYEFRCASCGQTTEKFFRSPSSAGDVIECPSCQAQATRLISAFSIPRGALPGAESGGDDLGMGLGGGLDDHGHGHGHGHSHGDMHGHAH